MQLKQPGLAFDKASARSFDKDGRLHVSRTPISKANVCPYLGNEIPGWDSLGLDPNKIYRMYRDAESLTQGASTFNNIQLTKKHIQVSADAPQKEEIVGSIGSDVSFEPPFLMASMCIWDNEAIGLVEAGKLDEISSAYHYSPVMGSGTSPDGDDYDGVMTSIVGNHVSLVEKGRAGPDVIVADALSPELAAIVGGAAMPIITAPKQKVNAMKQTKLGKALVAVLSAVSPKLAQDSALSSLVGGATRKGFDKKSLTEKLVAMDADLDVAATEAAIDSVADLENVPEPKEPDAPAKDDDGGKHGEIIDYLRSKGLDASDLEAVGNMLTRLDRPFGEDEKPVDVEAEVKTAMDSLSGKLRAEFKALEVAKHAVRPVVGDVLGMDSAEAVYRFALDHMKVENKAIAADGLPVVFAAIQTSKTAAPVNRTVAMDSATAVKRFPGLARFQQ